jgi:hypothetical protein
MLKRVRKMPDTPPNAESFEQVLEVELQRVAESREQRRVPRLEVPPGPLEERAFRSGLIGLAFSGGGIRSATFNLGLLQGLARWEMLHAVDYLSTVSGGGYIGSWLHAWIRRAPGGIHEVCRRLMDWRPSANAETESPRPIEFLRRYSNYLTPRTGLLSTDTWTMISIWLRNTLLNQLILFLCFASALMLPRAAKEMIDASHGDPVSLYVSVPLMLLAVSMIGLNLSTFDSAPTLLAKWLRWLGVSVQQRKDQWFHQPGVIQLTVLAPIVLVSLLASAWFAYHVRSPEPDALGRACVVIAASLAWFLVMMSFVGGLGRAFVQGQKSRRWIPWVALPAIDVTAAALGGGALYLAALPAHSASTASMSSWTILVWGTPSFLGLFTLVMVLKIGLLGKDFPDERREWLSRLGASILLYIIGWIVVCGMAVYGPLIALRLHVQLNDAWTTGAVAGWAGTVATGLWAANSSRTGDPEKPNRSPLSFLARIAPAVFIAGLFLLLSAIIHYTIVRTHGVPPRLAQLYADGSRPSSLTLAAYHADFLNLMPGGWAFVWACVLFFAAWLLAVRVDINEFSLHQFYRNRLVRCYLGASRNHQRKPNLFTGFDPDDDERLAHFGEGYGGPYPIVNTAMNLVHGENLAWQERKAESFVFTPEFCGYHTGTPRVTHPDQSGSSLSAHGYRPTRQYGGRFGPDIGKAMAISGAAASPNSGYHSNAAAAFLMTVFDVRLGWWVGNPRRDDHWRSRSPLLGLLYLMYELLGMTDDRRGFVYLSDGGHFENLALYELVRRRCRYIIVSDAEQDGVFKFEGLGNAIRKCRTDFGVEIDLAVDQLRPDAETGLSPAHCVVGTVRYPERDSSGAPMEGRIVYIKPVLTGDEPTDVLEYRRRDKAFPHTPTSDQWFDESQFESYRRLGLHAANTIFRNTAEEIPLASSRERFFRMLSQQWHPPSRAVQSKFTAHTRTLSELVERLRQDSDLRFLHTQINPEWQTLMREAFDPPRPEDWLPNKERELRAGYLFCNSIIQLMENVYIDLNLEEEWAHPDNRGWMNLFNHWVWSSMFRVTWAASASCYGARFQNFCQKRLELPLGQVQVRRGHLKDLNFYERRRYEEYGQATDSIWRLELRVDNPVNPVGQAIAYRFGFALVDSEQRLVFYRVQNHVRKMGLWSAVHPMLCEKAEIRGTALRPRRATG